MARPTTSLRAGRVGPPGDGAIPAIVSAALWLNFVGMCLRPLVSDIDILRNGTRFIGEIGAVLLIMSGLFWVVRVKSDAERRPARLWAVAVLAVSIPPAIAGLAFGNKFVMWAHLGLFPFASAAAIYLGAQRSVMDRVIQTIWLQVSIGAAFAIVVLAVDPPRSRVEWNGFDGFGLAKQATRSMYAMPFLLALVDRLSVRRAVAVVVAYVVVVAMAIVGANRGQFINMAVLVPLLLATVAIRGNKEPILRFLRLVSVTALGISLALVLSGQGARYGDYFAGRWDEIASRLTSGRQDGTGVEAGRAALETSREEFAGDESRGGEVRAFLSQLDAADLVAGRGWGGTWYSSFWRTEWGMVHIGPAHLVLEGGLPLMFVILVLLGHALLSAWRGAVRWPAARGALVVIATYTTGFLQHGAMQDEIEVYFLWLCVGVAFGHRAMWRPFDPAPPAANRSPVPNNRLVPAESAR